MRDPDITGTHARAWKASPSAELRTQWPAGLDMYLVHCPSAHPFWSWYVVSGCSLAPMPGLPPAKMHRPGMSHEVMVFALDPDFKPDDDWCSAGDKRWAKHLLTPANLCEQFGDLTDDQANELVWLLVRAFCLGHASPDSDHASRNRELLAGTADHLRAGRHVPS